MRRGSKIIFALFILLVVVSISATHYKYVVLKDFETYYDDYSEQEIIESTEYE
jgi:hypothetical protein